MSVFTLGKAITALQRHSAVPVSWGLRFNADLKTAYTHTGTDKPCLCRHRLFVGSIVPPGVVAFLMLVFAVMTDNNKYSRRRCCHYGGIGRVKATFMGHNM